jgi:hypothetical protein
MDLNNLLIWTDLDEAGNPNKIVKLQAIDPKTDIDAALAKWQAGSKGFAPNTYSFVKKFIKIPSHVFDVDGVGFIMSYNGKPHRAILPYFVLIERDKK